MRGARHALRLLADAQLQRNRQQRHRRRTGGKQQNRAAALVFQMRPRQQSLLIGRTHQRKHQAQIHRHADIKRCNRPCHPRQRQRQRL